MPPRQVREESWNSLHHSEASGDNLDDGYTDTSMDGESEEGAEHSTAESPTLPTIGDIHRALHPLQATADRVGRQVELFAESLDRLKLSKRHNPQQDCSHALKVMDAYKKIAKDTVNHLETMHAPERRQELSKKTKRKIRKSSGLSTPGLAPADEGKQHDMKTTVEDLKYWEQEEQTWDLLGLILQVEYPVQGADGPKSKSPSDWVRPKQNLQVHHYSPEKDVWDNFLAVDDQAWERHTVVEWLKKCADKSGQNIEQVVEELESGADRGSGLWAHSWLYSKEAIKGQKRLRSWPKALEPDSPGLDASLLNSEKTLALITQLDPDAITRQGRSLEKQDHYFERAIWLACWEMVRRGKDWEYMQQWCRDRVENWRATAVRGDPRNTLFLTSSAANWQSRALWRKTCALAAKDGGTDEYENAVYGVLSGYLPSVQKVSRSWDDFLFAHYNSYLLHSFDLYVKNNFADRVPNALTDQNGSFNFSIFGGQRTQSGNQIVEKMKHFNATKEEAREPIKMLQGSLIAKTFDEFVFKQGVRLVRSANAEGRSKILSPMDGKLLENSVTASVSMSDHDLLRLFTHIIFIYQDLGFDFGEGERRYAMESIIVAYVDYLSKAGKQQLLPLYASRLSSQRSIACLGRQLPSILDSGERKTMMRLMVQEGINVPAVLNIQLIMIITDTPVTEESGTEFPSLKILEPKSMDDSRPRSIMADFVGDNMTDDEEDLIHGFEWYLLLDGLWRETLMVGEVIYKHMLRLRSLAAARHLSQSVPFSSISLSKTNSILGRALDISESQASSEDEETGRTSRNTKSRYTQNQRRRRSSSARRIKSDREHLLNKASTFRDLENLFAALDALEKWKMLAEEGKKYLDPRHDGRIWKSNLQKACNRVEITVDPLLRNWLQDPKNDAEADEFQQIRVACLPEVVLAYIIVLDSSSRSLSRDLLLKGMDLAALIAAEDSDLAACFVAADRMPELVDSFAILSQSIIQADVSGPKNGKSKKKKGGETLSLWTVRAPSP